MSRVAVWGSENVFNAWSASMHSMEELLVYLWKHRKNTHTHTHTCVKIHSSVQKINMAMNNLSRSRPDTQGTSLLRHRLTHLIR